MIDNIFTFQHAFRPSFVKKYLASPITIEDWSLSENVYQMISRTFGTPSLRPVDEKVFVECNIQKESKVKSQK